MMAVLKAVFFDLDGTLIDTAPDFVFVVNTMLKQDNLAPVAEEDIRNTVSDGSRALIRLAYKIDESDPKFESLRQRLLDLYEQNIAVNSQPFPGINDLLKKLDQHDIAWGIATNKPEHYTRLLMQQLQLESAPVIVLSPEQVPQAKPAPDALFFACQAADCTINQAVYIGDHKRDIDCGINAGMKTITAAYGYVPKDDDITHWNADFIVNSAKELWPLIESEFLYTSG